VAFLFADIRGYTAYTGAHGADAAAQLSGVFAGLADEVVSAHGGMLVGTWGDEVLAEFASARAVVPAALELQARCRAWTIANPGAPLAAGVGLDIGEPVAAEDSRASEALNLAARLCSAAGPGEVLASRELMHLAGQLRGQVRSSTRRLRLKGIRGRTEVLSVRPLDPDLESERQFRAVLRAQPAGRGRRRRSLAVAALLVALVAAGIAGWLVHSAPDPAPPRVPGQSLAAIDTRTGRLLATVSLDGSPTSVVASPDGRQVWVTEPAAGRVVGIDPATDTVFQTIAGLADPTAIAVVRGYLWVVQGAIGQVTEYDRTGQQIDSVAVGDQPSAIAAGFGALWITNQGDGTLTRVDPSGARPPASIRVGASPSAVTVGSGQVWVANRGFNTVTPVDPHRLHAGEPVPSAPDRPASLLHPTGSG
jgi:class 3 adenylate cyclase/DNA-binding beta-propeller fold protein YncE